MGDSKPVCRGETRIALARIHGGARVEEIASSAPLPQFRVETDEGERALAASFKITGANNVGGAGEPHVAVDLEVESGELSVCSMKLHSRHYLSREEFVAAGTRRTVYVPIPASGGPCRVTIRNSVKLGRSVARIHGMALRRIELRVARRENSRYALWDAALPAPYVEPGRGKDGWNFTTLQPGLERNRAPPRTHWSFR